MVIRNTTGGWDVVTRVGDRLTERVFTEEAESAGVSRIKHLAAHEGKRGECTFTFVKASAVLALEGGRRLPRYQTLPEHALEKRTVSLSKIGAGESDESILVVSSPPPTRTPRPGLVTRTCHCICALFSLTLSVACVCVCSR